jgi:hypothetical protein
VAINWDVALETLRQSSGIPVLIGLELLPEEPVPEEPAGDPPADPVTPVGPVAR